MMEKIKINFYSHDKVFMLKIIFYIIIIKDIFIKNVILGK